VPETAMLVLRDLLLLRYGDLKRRLTRRLGCTELAGDALQDTWLRLESREPVENLRDPVAYLMRTAINAAYDQQRNQTRLVSASEIEAVLEDEPDSAPGPAETVAARAELEALMAAMERLPERRRQILVMVRWEHLPQREVAERLGVSLRTVEQELKKAHDYCAARLGRSSARQAEGE